MITTIPFHKGYTSQKDLTTLLLSRGLMIHDTSKAEHYLMHLAKLRWLFVEFPEIDLKALGFPQGWEMEPLWR